MKSETRKIGLDIRCRGRNGFFMLSKVESNLFDLFDGLISRDEKLDLLQVELYSSKEGMCAPIIICGEKESMKELFNCLASDINRL